MIPLYEVLERIRFRAFLTKLYRVRVDGAERIPERGPVILVANHESLIDPWILALATRRHLRYMAKSEFFKYSLTRLVMNLFGTFPIERGGADADALGRAGELLEQGEALGIFPQGTCLPFRSRRWRSGAARIALASGTPIVPVCIVGTEKALRPHRPKLGRPRIRILIAEPLEVTRQEPTVAAARALTARIEETIADLRRPFGPPAHVWID
ncbi:MAG: lysophospholipid acyltransferase family protein [Gaiellaceae bacterium]